VIQGVHPIFERMWIACASVAWRDSAEGYGATKKEHFYGLRGHLVITGGHGGGP